MFIFTMLCCASMVYVVIVCLCIHLSVRLSVTSQSSTKTAKLRITQTTCTMAQGLWCSGAEDLGEITIGSSPMRVPNTGGVG